ncbi:hypothetical protein SCB71_06625 [Herbiconiux sp. KACC 21604]|uniref:hypothetical protein n=1 Tax=unclassified Herbiconiux TaxID=2618217 RepID=UPI00149309C6|nr:hypothetical protein [Herbiconiux sp. SALV-R1]QJU52985.1 hypothetical protein HL652_04605 [Herbiconiux sp. SALV-R1]WPO87914.1 hypothetical protein SCB71_06625 [Herbiconiux sp. KACC 21604]
MTDRDLSGPEFTGETALEAAPAEIKLSFGLWLAEAIFGIFTGIAIAVIAGIIPDVVGIENDEAVVAVSVLIGIGVFTAVIAIFRIICSVYMLRGRVWARNTLTILGLLGLVGVWSELQTFPGVAIAHALVLLVALVTLYLPRSNAYFRAPFPAATPN